MTTIPIISNFNNICRTCLRQEIVINIFDKIIVEDEVATLPEMMLNFMKIVVSKDDMLPKHICRQCLKQVYDLYQFKHMCVQNDCILKQQLSLAVIPTVTGMVPNSGKLDTKNKLNINNQALKIDNEIINLDSDEDNSLTIISDTDSEKKSSTIKQKSRKKCKRINKHITKADKVESNKNGIKQEFKEQRKRTIKDVTKKVKEKNASRKNEYLKSDDESVIEFSESDDSMGVEKEVTKVKLDETDDESHSVEPEDYPEKSDNEELEKFIKEKDSEKRNSVKKSVPYCKECEMFFATEKDMQEHRARVLHPNEEGVLQIQCADCGKMIGRKNINQHMNIHKGIKKTFICEICGKTFTEKGNLRRHNFIHTGEKPYVCSVCGKAFIQSNSLTEHMRTHSNEAPYLCYYCGKTFKQLGLMKQHIKYKHSDKPESKDYKCVVCEKSFHTVASLKSHMTCHGEKKFMCELCDKTFASKVALASHTNVHTGNRRFKCNLCPKSFIKRQSLQTHERIHSGIRPYTCQICGKSFNQRSHLGYHIRMHVGDKRYQCKYCDKRFTLNGNLKVHQRIHTGETPYVCHICNKGFYDSSKMKKHVRTHEVDTKKTENQRTGIYDGKTTIKNRNRTDLYNALNRNENGKNKSASQYVEVNLEQNSNEENGGLFYEFPDDGNEIIVGNTEELDGEEYEILLDEHFSNESKVFGIDKQRMEVDMNEFVALQERNNEN